MIKNIVFDFGDIFIDLDKSATLANFQKLNPEITAEQIDTLNKIYEVGEMTSTQFVFALKDLAPNASYQEVIDAWNSILLEYPVRRFEFFKKLVASGKYRLFLLSNTNDLHIIDIANKTPHFDDFKAEFEQFYLSHEIGMRKPNREIFEFVLNENELKPEETLFVDDTKENIDAAASIGIHTWHLIPGTDDVTELFTKKSDLF